MRLLPHTLIIIAALLSTLKAQTIINTPVINTYAAVTTINFCTNSMEVADNTELDFSIGDYVLIIQMQGAITSIQNTDSAFGTIINYSNAGHYEYNRVKGINLGAVDGIQFQNELSHPYEVAGKVQIVKVPQYQDVIIQNTLSCLPWDGSKGGIIVLEASGSVELQANIFADEIGFRGGAFSNDNSCFTTSGGFSGYFCTETDNCGGYIGEGVGYSYNSKLKGRARNANGGGGGNDHNAGGAGGANGGNGGNGGDNDLNTQFCNGSGGLGGERNNPSASENRLLMGGGGGAGDSNNQGGTEGGDAGAMVIIKANSITSNGFKISCNGQDAANGSGDGTGGGGAGGTIVLDVNQYNDAITIEANGGNGGDNNDPGNCPGVGGGGSGGLLWVKQNSLPTDIDFIANGGTQGIYTSVTCTGLQLGVQDGENGRAIFNYQPIISEEEYIATSIQAENDTIICLGDSALFSAQVISSSEIDFDWAFEGLSVSTQNPWYVKPLERGVYNYTARAQWTAFGQQCEEIDDVSVELRNPDISLILSPNIPVDTGGPVFINGVISPTNPAYIYSWEPSFVEPNGERNVVVEPFETTNYCLTVTDELGCKKTACNEVKVNIPPTGSPTAFTPNDDGVNDAFRIIPLPQLRQKSLKIYNRWGDLLFESESQFSWDGTFNSEKQQTDSYIWVAEFEHKNTKEKSTQSGEFLLIR